MEKKYSEKILLVDDDVKNLQVAMSILKDYNVIYAKSAQKALELLEINQFDLILLDVVMPVMDGYALCELIKKDERTKNIPIIFLTVKDEEADIVKGFSYGAVDYVTKPFFSQVLLKRVQIHVKLSNVMKELNQINKNLEIQVQEQVQQLRQKDDIINKQAQITAMANIIDVIADQWSQPVSKLKFYLQAINLESKKNQSKSFELLELSLQEISALDAIIKNFQKFFAHHSKERTNLKVLLDTTIYQIQNELDTSDIIFDVQGDNLLYMNIVPNEIKHIFATLINHSINTFQKEIQKEKLIQIAIEKQEDHIVIQYHDNAHSFTKTQILELFENPNKDTLELFNLSFYLIKVFIEKNGGSFDIQSEQNGSTFIIKF